MLPMGRLGCPPRTQPRLEVTGMATEAMEVNKGRQSVAPDTDELPFTQPFTHAKASPRIDLGRLERLTGGEELSSSVSESPDDLWQ